MGKKLKKTYGGYAVPFVLDKVIRYFTENFEVSDYKSIGEMMKQYEKLLYLVAELVCEIERNDWWNTSENVFKKYFWEIDRLVGFSRNKEDSFEYLKYVVFMIRISGKVENCVKFLKKKAKGPPTSIQFEINFSNPPF